MKRFGGNEYKYVKQVLDTGCRTSMGSMMSQRFEAEFAEKFQAKYVISCINGTQTMHAILEAAGIGVGDEVIVPPLTMASTTFAVLQCGATPVFADVDARTFLITPEAIKERITDRTRGVIPVSLYGAVPRMDEIMEIASANSLFVLEDNAQCVLGTYKGKQAGTFGHASSYSLQSSKHITAGEGGMVTTNDKELADQVRRAVSLGYAGVGAGKGKITRQDIQSPDYLRHLSMGWNYRMPELCAAVGLAQLERIDELVRARIDSAKLFLDALEGCQWLIPQYIDKGSTCVYWTFVCKLERDDITWFEFRDKFSELGGDGIYAAWTITYLEPVFLKMNLLGREKSLTLGEYKKGLCPVAEYLQPRLLQFKTNYWDIEEAKIQADILRRTIEAFS